MSPFNLEGLAKSANEGPVAMLNLVKYRNREAYGEYARLTGKLRWRARRSHALGGICRRGRLTKGIESSPT